MNIPLELVPSDPDPRARLAKLEKINRVLMGRVERSTDVTGNGFSLFQTAILLEGQVRARTEHLERTLADLSDANIRMRQARDEAETAKGNLTAAIEAVGEGFALFDDRDRLVLCNTPFRQLMPDVGPKLLPGMSFADIAGLFSQSRHIVLEADLPAVEWNRVRLDMFRRPHAIFVQQVTGDRWVQVTNERTNTGATVILQTDITDLVRRERERQHDEQSRVLQAMIDHLPQGICMVSSEHRLKAWNHGFISLLALPVKLVQPGASFGRILDHVRDHVLVTAQDGCDRLETWLAESESRYSLNLELARSDGVVLDVSCNQMPDGGMVATFTNVTTAWRASEALQMARNSLKQKVSERTLELQTANVKLSHEIAERRAIERELILARDTAEDANRSKTHFLAAASHGLLQPLNAARIFLSLLVETALDTQQHNLARKLDDAFGSVDQILGTLLDISRFDSGAVDTDVHSFRLDDVLGKLSEEFRPLADRKGLRLVYVRTGLLIKSDARHLRRIIQNLLANAIHYTSKGRVMIDARRAGSDATIEILDTGPGIAREFHEAIFEEFRRLNNDVASQHRGTGLGLAIVQRIGRLLGHSITVRSELGRGSCFGVKVPCVAEAEHRTTGPAARPVPQEALTGKHVLLLENDLRILDAMMFQFGQWQMNAIPAASINEALDLVEGDLPVPDIIVADYHLDAGTGLDAIEMLRALKDRAIPAILVTADRGSEVQDAAAKLGIEVLHKPIHSQDLSSAIGRALGKSAAQVANRGS